MMRFGDIMFGFPDLLFVILLMVVFKSVGVAVSGSRFMRAIVSVNNAFGGLLFIKTGTALALTMIAFNFLGDGLRDALDPQMAR
jgi:ABC-type dipeptide/oligopeptide/nickel transport system permease subunit